ncbi:MAG: YtcA family lipoprotein [Bryobacteraceae bacterium]
MKQKVAVLFFLAPLPACARSPMFNLFGSYFPGWMLCVLAAILLTVLVRLVVRRLKLDDHVEPAAVTYLALTLFFSFTLWLVLFA